MKIEFRYLADQQKYIPIIAKWYYEEWGHKNQDDSLELTIKRLQGNVSSDSIPLHILAFRENELTGVAELRYREMDIYPEKEHWLSGVNISPLYRGQGLAKKLLEHVVKIAADMGVKNLFLQTEKRDGGLYSVLQWQIIERVNYKGLDVTIMVRQI